MADAVISNVRDKLIVGQIDTSFLSLSSKFLPGTAVLNGPVYMGALTGAIGLNRATCTIGPSLPGLNFPASLEVDGISNFFGNTNTEGVATFNGIEIKNSLDNSNGVKVNHGSHITTATKTIVGNLNVTGRIIAVSYNGFIGACAGKKNFDIKHPTKEGWRLRHVCIEGPTADVYVRGKLNNSNIIELPEYWIKLVDAETITVNLTPIGTYQELFVEKIEWGTKIYIKNNSGTSIKCHYTVYGERKDTSKNIPEYEGTYGDYPGNNDEYILSAIRK